MRTSAIKIFGIMILTLACIMLWTPNAQAILIDDFNSQNGSVGAFNYDFGGGTTGWTVTNGTVDLIPTQYGGFNFFPLNGHYIDLDGSTNDAGILATTAYFGAGNYTLQFDLAGSQRGDKNTVVVSLGSWSESFIDIPSGQALTTITRSFSTSGGNLTFENLGGDNLGAILDNVDVTSVSEPSILILFGAGLVGLGLIRKKFKN
jgi:hypothetical protein